MGIHSGKFGTVNGVTAVRNWQINETSSPQAYSASNTRGGMGRRNGIKDWTGSFGCYGAVPTHLPGNSFAFAGYTAPDNDTLGATGPVLSGTALVDSIALNINFETGEVINHVVNFSGNGALAKADATPYDDIAIPDFDSGADGGKIYVMPEGGSVASGSFGDGYEVCNITTVALNLLASNQAFVNSCTNGWTGRKAGIVDWNMAVGVQEDDKEELGFDIGDDLELRVYFNANEYILLRWAHVESFSGLTIDREGGTIITQTINFQKNGFLDNQIGLIRLHNDVWWP